MAECIPAISFPEMILKFSLTLLRIEMTNEGRSRRCGKFTAVSLRKILTVTVRYSGSAFVSWLLLPQAHSRLIPICNAFFIQRGHRRSLPILRKLSNRGGERRWPQNKTGVVHRYQATVLRPLWRGSPCCTDSASRCNSGLKFRVVTRVSAMCYPGPLFTKR